MTDAGSTGDDIDKTLDIVDGLINNTDNPKDSTRSKLLNRTVPSASDDIGEAEDLYIGETDEIVEEVVVEKAVTEGGDDSTQDNVMTKLLLSQLYSTS